MGPPIPPASAERKLVRWRSLNVNATLRTHCTASFSRKAATMWWKFDCAVRFAAFPLNGCVNGESRRCNRLSSLPLCSSLERASRREIFHVSNFDAKARSTAFSHRHIGGAWMTDVLHWGSLYGPRVQNLAAVTETVKLRSPARRSELFWELIRCQCSAPVPQLFRRYSFRSSP
jgi:hypothetical protein